MRKRPTPCEKKYPESIANESKGNAEGERNNVNNRTNNILAFFNHGPGTSALPCPGIILFPLLLGTRSAGDPGSYRRTWPDNLVRDHWIQRNMEEESI